MRLAHPVRRPFTPATGVQIPLGTPKDKNGRLFLFLVAFGDFATSKCSDREVNLP